MSRPGLPLLLLAAASLVAVAQSAPPPGAPPALKPPAGGPIAIPQAAFDACAGKTAGAAVSWKGMHGNLLKGSCRPYSAGVLVAVPGDLPVTGAASRPAPAGGGLGARSLGGTMMVPPPPNKGK